MAAAAAAAAAAATEQGGAMEWSYGDQGIRPDDERWEVSLHSKGKEVVRRIMGHSDFTYPKIVCMLSAAGYKNSAYVYYAKDEESGVAGLEHLNNNEKVGAMVNKYHGTKKLNLYIMESSSPPAAHKEAMAEDRDVVESAVETASKCGLAAAGSDIDTAATDVPHPQDAQASVVPVLHSLLETGTKRSLAGMEQQAKKKTKVGGSSSSGADQSSAVESHMDTAATDVPHSQDAQAADVLPPQNAQADNIPALNTPLAPRDSEYNALLLKVKPSVVTVSVSSVAGIERAKYGTGFILFSETSYALVFTSIHFDEDDGDEYRILVHLEENNQGVRADLLRRDKKEKKIHILFVPTEKKHATLSFLEEDIPVHFEKVITVGATAGTKLRDGPVVEAFLGKLDIYWGRVLTCSCSALTLDYKHVKGSEKYFEVRCLARDGIIDMKDIDLPMHPSLRIESAPVFTMSGKVVGFIHSAGTQVDLKNGYLCKSIIKSIRSMCSSDTGSDWKVELEAMGRNEYEKRCCNAPVEE